MGAGIIDININSSGITSSFIVINLSNIDKNNQFMIHTKITKVREYSVMKIRIRMYPEHSITNMIGISYALNAVSDMGGGVNQEKITFN